MAKYKVVHYINQFFAGIGGEEKADHMPEVREGAVGPGMGLKAALGSDYEIAATVICGDNYFGENLDAATDTIIEMVKKCEPDVFVAGPAFNADVTALPAVLSVRQWKSVWASRLSPVCISRILAWICSARTLSLWIHLTPQPVCQRYFLLCPL